MKQNSNDIPKVLFAFDFGTKRIGVAVGQTVTQTARPLETLAAKDGLPNWDMLNKLMKKWQPNAMVVGIPVNMDGSDQAISLLAREFADNLRKHYHLPVYEIDERLTTKDAREQLFAQGGYKALQEGQVDRLAAQLILKNWFADYLK